MKRLRHILNTLVWTLLGSYLLLSILLHIPAIQEYTGRCVAKILEDKFGTEVSIGYINLGFLNRLIIDDFNMLDKKDKEMLHASRLSVSMDVTSLLKGQISISSAQFFGLRANLYKETAAAETNFQFVLDSLKSKDESKTKLDLHIGSFIIRNGAVKYNNLYIPPTPSKFNTNHISVTHISSDIRIRHITDDEVNLGVKKFSFAEKSGLHLKNLSFSLSANRSRVSLKGLRLELPNSTISSDSITATYIIKGDGKIDLHSLSSKGNLHSDAISLPDFAFLLPKLKSCDVSLKMRMAYEMHNGRLHVIPLSLRSADNDIRLSASGELTPFAPKKEWKVRLGEFSIGQHTLDNVHRVLSALRIALPEQVLNVKEIKLHGNAVGRGSKIVAKTELSTNLGYIKSDIRKTGNNITLTMSTTKLKVGELLSDKDLGSLTLNVKASGKLQGSTIRAISANGDIPSLEYRNYTYKNAKFNVAYNGTTVRGDLSISDPNIDLDLSGSAANITKMPATNFTATINRFCPQRLNISKKWDDAVFSTKISAHTNGKSISRMEAGLMVRDFQFKSATDEYSINTLDANISPDKIKIDADFGSVELNGKYNIATIGESIFGILKKKLPTLPGIDKKIYASDNRFTLNASITDTKWIEILAGVPFHSDQPINIHASIDDISRSINADMILPDFSYGNDRYRNGGLSLKTINDTLFADISLRKLLDDSNGIKLHVKANAADNRLNSTLDIDYNTPTRIKGTLNTHTKFYKDHEGNNSVLLELAPSTIMVKDTAWNVSPSSIIYNSQKIQINHFAIGNGKQHIKIDGLATKSPADSICVDLNDVDVNYILDLVEFHSVEFSGRATGQAYLKSVLNTPDAYALLTVNDFKFQEGDMGVLHARVDWNKAEKQIDINATADESEDARTLIKGYVSPERNYIDLGITAEDTNIEFMKSFCSSFMSDINARANGFAQVYGDLSEVNLRGLLVANGNLKISTLNTRYYLKNDTIRMEPDEIIFSGDTVRDKNDNIAIIKGALHHKNLTRLTFDLDIEAHDFLCYDHKSYDDNTFYGTVYGTGNCSITGRPHSIVFNIDMTPVMGSFIEYNTANPDAITSQDFISWAKHNEGDTPAATPLKDLNESSDIHLNFNVNTTPDFTLRVLMDQASGDKIALNGNGNIKASYFNKGNFDMYGTYLIDHGSYNLTIQNIIKKDFQFKPGSNIVFGGNPFNALLNLKAAYQVNGVPLADLKIGNSFSSNNVRVDCIMNIGGTPENIKVDFDFDMPTVNNDAKQMVRSLINSEEEMNQQVIYLLAIGRFYMDNVNNSAQEDAQQSQTSLAMQSLLSGTISQQVSSLLSSVINNNNWNFGTNISTGTEGFNNAEYEGLLSGSLFSNRLLINGQFGYRDNPNTTSSFIGDFDLKYLLTPSGNIAIKVYNQTNDRYFTKSSINTQGLGLILKRDFGNWRELFRWKKRKK